MILKNTILLFLLFLFFIHCNKEKNEVIVPQAHTVDKAEKVLLETSNEFGYRVFSDLAQKKTEKENLIISPINAGLAFNILMQASNKTTTKQIKQFLRIGHLKDTSITKGFDNLNRLFSEIDQKTKIKGQNKIITSYPPLPEKLFKSFVANRNYAEIKEENNYKKLETTTLQQHSFQLINSLDFEASTKFQKRTNELPFYNTPDEISFVEMIVAESTFNQYSDATIQAVELPLGRGNFNLLIIIPQGSQTISDITTKLDERLLKRVRAKFKPSPLEVYLPLLNISGTETFKHTLKKSRISTCFNKGKADFSRLSPETKTHLSDFQQITTFNLKAAENSSSSVSLAEKSSWLIDRPFIFVVYEKYSEATILIGKISQL